MSFSHLIWEGLSFLGEECFEKEQTSKNGIKGKATVKYISFVQLMHNTHGAAWQSG